MLNHVVWLLFSFNGRLGRLGYFTGWLGLSLCGGALHVANLGQWLKPEAARPDVMVLLLQATLSFALAWGHFAIQAKRLHDFNWSGWWVLAPGAAIVGLVVTWIAGLGAASGETVLGLGLLTVAAAAFVVVVGLMLLFRGGTAGPNNYAPRSGPPDTQGGDAAWAQRVLNDPLAAAERLGQQESSALRSSVAAQSRPTAAAGERVFGRRNVRT
jgi:uncharacterized membrane protein YhaH (DUF805 family)